MKPTEQNGNVKSCWSLITWDWEPGAPSKAGEDAQAGGDQGDNFVLSRGVNGGAGEMRREGRDVGGSFGLSDVGKMATSRGTCRFRGLLHTWASWLRTLEWGLPKPLLGTKSRFVQPLNPSAEVAPSEKSRGNSEYWLVLVKHLKIKYAACEQVFAFLVLNLDTEVMSMV